jgi:probable HAF family extracellular repeat protein
MKLQKQKNKDSKPSIVILMVMTLLYCNGYAQQPTLTWLGTLGGSKSEAQGVSDDGSVVVGVSSKSNGSYRAFKWTAANGMQDMGTLGGDESEATGISSDGSVIVGWSYDGSSIYRAFKWNVTDGMQDFGAGEWSKATAVSKDGLVIIFNISPVAYRWTLSGGLQNLGNLGTNNSGANAISSNGSIIVGYSYNTSNDPYAFRWVNGIGMEQIGTYYSFAQGVSGDGSTVTGFETGSAGLYRAFRWTQTGGFEFNIAGNFSQGNAVSGDGSIIVGDNAGGAFRLSNAGGLEELNQVYSGLLSPGSDLYSAFGISSNGQYIIGYGLNGTTGRDEGYLLAVSGTTSVDETQINPGNFVLDQNYPNPFNPSTTINFSVPSSEFVTLKVFDVLGNEAATLVNEEKLAGSYEVDFDASQLSSGIYFYKLQAGSLIETKKMMLIR